MCGEKDYDGYARDGAEDLARKGSGHSTPLCCCCIRAVSVWLVGAAGVGGMPGRRDPTHRRTSWEEAVIYKPHNPNPCHPAYGGSPPKNTCSRVSSLGVAQSNNV